MEKNTPANTAYKKSSFGPAFFFLSKRRRGALAAYYEFCRLMDDIADEPDVKDPQKELDFWQAEVDRIFTNRPQTPLGKQLAQVVKEFGLSKDRFTLLMEGMRYDISGKTYATFKDLSSYMYRVAVIVGLATLDILGIKGAAAQELAENLGTAVQLTNIIRDVPADAQLNRVYLPSELLGRYGLTRADVLAGKDPQKIAQVLAHLSTLAQDFYDKAQQNMKQFARLKMLPCQMMACVYARNLAKIEGSRFLFERPLKLTKWEKLVGVCHACWKTMVA